MKEVSHSQTGNRNNDRRWPQLPTILCFIALCVAITVSQAFAIPLQVVSPANNSWVTEGRIFLAGQTDKDVKQVHIKGVKTDQAKGLIRTEGNGFGTMITLKKGLNSITVSDGKSTHTINVFYTSASEKKSPPQGFKHFSVHKSQTVLDCKECHRQKRGIFNFKRVLPARANCTTGKCHSDKGNAPHVHGPIGAGFCISCHSPHGSFKPMQMERSGPELCLVCHQQKEEELKMDVVHPPVEDGCVDCHDPHQSKMRFQLRGDGKSVSSLCFNCHEKNIFNKEHRHGPVGAGDCIACHRPHAGKYKKLLIAPTAKGQLCFKCHQDRKDGFNRKYVHAPVAKDCGNCHDPHSSANRFQLIKDTKTLCKSCHSKLTPGIYKDMAAKVKHPPVAEERCTACHDVHSSNYQPLLKNSTEKLCFSCHIDLGDDVAESKHRHGPVKTGDCTSCHRVHGSEFAKLLVRYFPGNFYSSYKSGQYNLCFGCHNKDIAKKKFTTTLTNFRDGKYNLHYFHVNMKKGRTCIACHDPHASNQNKHIRYEVPFGDWSYPINFTKRPTGGTCIVGCHAPKTYDRQKPQITPSR
ncbi:MAG: hypothetical protein OEL66_00010 [Desulfobulbaceae bacterium]|nr:hypothetical protein [Desulfobulbaceae bacterium]